MVRVVALSLLALGCEALDQLYGGYFGVHCYVDHGGVPLDVKDAPIAKDIDYLECEALCNGNDKCRGFSQTMDPKAKYTIRGDCYLRSDVDLQSCDVSKEKTWATFTKVDPAPLSGNVIYHLFESKYTGLGDKDGGDYRGDRSFIFATFANFSKGNPEASMDHNILEMSEVNVTGWGKYEQCNAPGATGMFTCPEDQTDYCCTTRDPKTGKNIPVNHTSESLPGLTVAFGPGQGVEFAGFWMSFPQASQDVTWSEKLLRRIAGKCLGDAWRKDSGGCSECGEALDTCVADCIQAALPSSQLQATWDRVFGSPEECPDVPFPGQSPVVV